MTLRATAPLRRLASYSLVRAPLWYRGVSGSIPSMPHFFLCQQAVMRSMNTHFGSPTSRDERAFLTDFRRAGSAHHCHAFDPPRPRRGERACGNFADDSDAADRRAAPSRGISTRPYGCSPLVCARRCPWPIKADQDPRNARSIRTAVTRSRKSVTARRSSCRLRHDRNLEETSSYGRSPGGRRP